MFTIIFRIYLVTIPKLYKTCVQIYVQMNVFGPVKQVDPFRLSKWDHAWITE